MSEKTHHTAAVIIPPGEIWKPIQVIRARYDAKMARWMPHITMAYPFRPREEFDDLAKRLGEALAGIPSFTLELAQFHHFDHGQERYTLWLDTEPREPILRLHSAMMAATPDCDDVDKYEFGFTPHLSVGQVRGREAMEQLRASLQARWHPLSFKVSELSLIWRGDPPDDVFRAANRVPLGGTSHE